VVPTSVLIVDDHAEFRASAGALLEAEGFAVVGAVADGASALEAVARLRPQVVLLDIRLPDLDGFEVATRLGQLAEPPLVVFVSSRDAQEYGTRRTTDVARGFLAKRELSGAALAELVG
jgi:CheY-like chemotaxis protein